MVVISLQKSKKERDMGAEKQSGECQVLASGGLACRCVGWLLPLVLKRPRLRLKIWNSWDGLGLGQTIVFGPWFLEPWGKDTQAEELGGWGWEGFAQDGCCLLVGTETFQGFPDQCGWEACPGHGGGLSAWCRRKQPTSCLFCVLTLGLEELII